MQPQEQIGRYTLLGRLGTGSGGEVWEALLEGPVGFRKRVALKVVAAKARDVRGLRHEARLGALLRHPNLVDVYELGTTPDGRTFLAMELVPGPSLGVLLKQLGPLPGPALRDVGMQLARGLGYVHHLDVGNGQVGLVHRDVKPTNVLLDPGGTVKLADLGIARLAGQRSKSIEGTPGYLAPEQLDGAAPAPPADVFSVGMVLWAMAVGKTPIRGGRGLAQALRAAMTAQSKALRARAILAEAVPGLDEIVLTCLDPDPAGRFVDGKELRLALRALREPPGAGLYEVLAGHDGDTADAPSSSATVTDRSSHTTGLRPEELAIHGRERERAAVEEALSQPGALVTLKGMAGIGKTRLAVHLAHRFAEGQLDAEVERRVMWADVGAARSEPGFLQAVAGALRVPLETADAEGALRVALADCGGALLVLDKVDDVRQVVGERLARWRELAPELRVLVTGRQALRVPSEVVVELGPLVQEAAMSLFFDRSVRRLSPGSEPHVKTLVGKLDHHPQAIELVAARTGLLDVPELIERLEHMSLGDDALERALAESWGELPPWSRLALVQISAFRGTFPVQAAEAVVDVSRWDEAPWPLDVIDDLWQRSILYVRHTSRGPRLGMSAAVRTFAVRHAGKVDVADALHGAERRHGEWYARMGDATRLEALRTVDGPDRVRELRADLEDLIAALERASSRQDWAVAEATGLAAAEVLVRRGPMERARRVVERVLSLPEATRRDHALLLRQLVDEEADPAQRQRWWSEALAYAPTPRRRARVLAQEMRLLVTQLDEPARALAAVDAGWSEVRASGDGIAQVWALLGRGVALRVQGDVEGAREALQDAIELSGRLGALDEEASGCQSLANLHYNLGEYDEAYRRYRRGEKLFRRLGSRSSVGLAISNQALIHYAQGRVPEGISCAKAAEEIGRTIGDERLLLAARSKWSLGLLRAGDYEDALVVLSDVMEVARSLRSWGSLAMTLCNRAHAFAALGRNEEGLPDLQEAADLARRVGSPRTEALAEGNLGLLHVDAGRLDAARSHLDVAVELSIGVDPRFEGGFRAARARRDVLAGQHITDDLTRARQLLEQVDDQAELRKLVAVEAMWKGLEGDVTGGLALVDGLPTDDPLLRQRIREAKRFLRGL